MVGSVPAGRPPARTEPTAPASSGLASTASAPTGSVPARFGPAGSDPGGARTGSGGAASGGFGPAGSGPAGSAAAGPAVRVERLVKRFGRGPVVLEGVDLDVAAGEVVCLVGASGCGKSTLLSLLAGLQEPTAGTARVAGERPALMFQEPALLPWLTAAGNIELALRLRGVPRRERREQAAELLKVVRLEGTGGMRPHQLSGGMQQRVALARALSQRSDVLLMDEPFGALDAITRDVLHHELSRVQDETGVAIVFVTHDVREAVRLGHRVVLLSSRPGRVIADWPVRIDGPRRADDPAVGELAEQITARLREEIRRHAA